MGDDDPVGVFQSSGVDARRRLESMLPADWSWPGKRVLDFGCGVGRVMRQFAGDAEQAEFWGCDLHRPSVEWMSESICPPFHVFESEDRPGLPQEDGFFDLIYAFSVYTHLTDEWAGWLLEHRRVLADGGVAVRDASSTRAWAGSSLGEPWDEDRVGRNSLHYGNPWDFGGPITFLSEWWVRAPLGTGLRDPRLPAARRRREALGTGSRLDAQEAGGHLPARNSRGRSPTSRARSRPSSTSARSCATKISGCAVSCSR